MKKIFSFIICLLIPLGVGGLSAWLTANSAEVYKNLIQPPLAPPSAVFPIVWTILFALMGISSFFIYNCHYSKKQAALKTYGLQLAVNFFWPILFFKLQMFLAAFIWLLILWLLIIKMIKQFWQIRPFAGILQVPYFLWVTFAAYLNLAVFILNK